MCHGRTIGDEWIGTTWRHYKLQHELTIFSHGNPYFVRRWRCSRCKAMSINVPRCFICSDCDDQKGQWLNPPTLPLVDTASTVWRGDEGSHHSRYAPSGSFNFNYIASRDEWGSEMPIPYWSGNGEHTGCYNETLFWLGQCGHVLIEDVSLAEEEELQAISLLEPDVDALGAVMDELVGTLRRFESMAILWSIMCRLSAYGVHGGWVVEQLDRKLVEVIAGLADDEDLPPQQIADGILQIGYPDVDAVEWFVFEFALCARTLNLTLPQHRGQRASDLLLARVDVDAADEWEDRPHPLIAVDVTPMRYRTALHLLCVGVLCGHSADGECALFGHHQKDTCSMSPRATTKSTRTTRCTAI